MSTQVQLRPKPRIKMELFPFNTGQQFGWIKDRLEAVPHTEIKHKLFFVLFSFLFYRLKPWHIPGDVFQSFRSAQLCLQPSSGIDEQGEGLLCVASPANWQLDALHSTKPERAIARRFFCPALWTWEAWIIQGRPCPPAGSLDFSLRPLGPDLQQPSMLGPNGTDWQEQKRNPKKEEKLNI